MPLRLRAGAPALNPSVGLDSSVCRTTQYARSVSMSLSRSGGASDSRSKKSRIRRETDGASRRRRRSLEVQVTLGAETRPATPGHDWSQLPEVSRRHRRPAPAATCRPSRQAGRCRPSRDAARLRRARARFSPSTRRRRRRATLRALASGRRWLDLRGSGPSGGAAASRSAVAAIPVSILAGGGVDHGGDRLTTSAGNPPHRACSKMMSSSGAM